MPGSALRAPYGVELPFAFDTVAHAATDPDPAIRAFWDDIDGAAPSTP